MSWRHRIATYDHGIFTDVKILIVRFSINNYFLFVIMPLDGMKLHFIACWYETVSEDTVLKACIERQNIHMNRMFEN